MRKKLLSLLVLLMVAVTGAWAQEETLLTTITPTGDDTYSETTAGAVTVTPAGSFFYSGSSLGWRWDYEGSLTVTANEGYTITRCVFIQQGKNQSVTISEAPFALHFEEWLCFENYSMDGVSSIEVYGYAPAAPEPEPEPQPAGYAVSLKAETADEGNWTAKAGEGEYQSLPLEGVAEGTQVTLTYSGLKKVKSVKAVKKAAAEPEPAGPTTVTWNSSNVSDIQFWGGAPDGYDSYTKEGITLRGNAEQCDASWQNWGGGQEGIMFAMNAPGGYTFTAPDGKKFTKIEITATTNDGWYTYAYLGQLESGWPSGEEAADNFNSTLKFTWTGSAASVNLATTLNSFGPSLVSSIEFTLAAGLTSYTLAESTVGMIVGTDGKAYDVADKDNLPDGVTAAGVVVYKNGANGLAIALTDEASMMNWDTACGENGAAAHTPAVSGCSWKLPSQEEWTLVKNANSGSSLNSAITNAGGTAIPTVHFDHETQTMTGQYWLSTQGAIDESARTWGINGYDEIVTDSQSLKTDNLLVRACLAW